MAASLSKPFLGAPHTSTGSLHSASLLLSRNIIHLPDRRSQLKRLGLTIGSPIKFYSETSPSLGCKPSRRAYCLSSKQHVSLKIQASERCVYSEAASKVSDGVLAMNTLKNCLGTDILAYVSQVHDVVLPESLVDHETLTYDQIKGSTIRCPNPEYAEKMIAAIEAVRVRGDSLGGTVTCIVRNFPTSFEAFREIAAALADGVMSLPATEGFEFGRGFTGTFMTGSEYFDESGQSDGMKGKISNPETIKMRIGFKPIVPPISRRKNTVRGDLDFCAVPRAVYLVEAMVALVLLPHMPSPTNAAVTPEPLGSPESAKAHIPLER